MFAILITGKFYFILIFIVYADDTLYLVLPK